MSNSIKLIIFDAYGVTLTGGYPDTCKFFAKKFKRDWQDVYKIIYKKYFNMAAERKITQKEAWELAVKELDFPIPWQEVRKKHYELMGVNKEIIKFAKNINKAMSQPPRPAALLGEGTAAIKTLLLSKNTRSQFSDIGKRLGFKDSFEFVINTWEIGLPKASEQTIRYIMKKFKVNADEIIYIDDQEENLIAAKKLGVRTIFYKNFAHFKREILLKINFRDKINT
ncbi:MAG: HAD-IA family hydrolase [bacterium]